MKRRLHNLILTLLIAALCVNCALPALAAVEMTDSERQHFEECFAASKDSYAQIYSRLWKYYDLDKKLADAIEKGVDEKMKSMMPGTRGIRTLWRPKVAEEAQALITGKFNPDYEKFYNELGKHFIKENARNISLFFKAIAADEIRKNRNNAEIVQFIRKKTKEILGKNEEGFQKQIEVSLVNKGIWTLESGAAIGGAALATASGFVLTKIISTAIAGSVAKKVGVTAILKGVGAKVVSSAAFFATAGAIAGAAITCWQGAKALSSVLNAPEDLKKQLKKDMTKQFRTQVPAEYWTAMESDIRVMFEEAYEIYRKRVGEHVDSANKPENTTIIENVASEEL